MLLGIISDTHGLLRPGVAEAFRDVDRILHAGDIDRPAILEALSEIAPVVAVRGNMDGGWARDIPPTAAVPVGSGAICLLHDLGTLDLTPSVAGFDAVVYGHTHRAAIDRQDGVLYLNPGAAGPRRRHPPSVALLRVTEREMTPEIIVLAE
jgi:uncharacterized protein